jgi:hypothetical protein
MYKIGWEKNLRVRAEIWKVVWGIAHLPHEDMHSQNPLGNGTTM